jgi:multidrug resistance protein
VGFGIVIPLLTFYAEDYQATPVQVTLLMAVYSLAQFAFAPLWGGLSDRVGRRPVLLVSLTASTLFLAGFAAAQQLWLLFLFRTLHGAAAANLSTAQACVADLTTPENRAKGMGLIGAAFGVGFTVGPFIGGELSRFGGHATPIWFAAGLSAVNLVLALWLLPETRRPGSRTRPRPVDPRVFLRVCRHPLVGGCVLLTFVLTASFSLVESTFTLFAEHLRGLDAPGVGRMFGIAGLATIVVQGGLIQPLVRRYGEGRLVSVGIAILGIAIVLLPYAPPFGAMLAVFIAMAVGQGIATPSLQSLISRSTPEDEQGLVLGTNQSMSALARAVAPAGSGLVYAHVAPQAPFLLAGAILVGGFVLSIFAVARIRSGQVDDPPGDEDLGSAGPCELVQISFSETRTAE